MEVFCKRFYTSVYTRGIHKRRITMNHTETAKEIIQIIGADNVS